MYMVMRGAVGHATVIRGTNVRTGVTAVFPRGTSDLAPVFAGWFNLMPMAERPVRFNRLLESGIRVLAHDAGLTSQGIAAGDAPAVERPTPGSSSQLARSRGSTPPCSHTMRRAAECR